MKAYKLLFLTFTISILAFVTPGIARAHCDGMDGPVVTLARQALASGNVNLVLPWVPENDESEIRRAFDHTIAVRKLGSEAKYLADRYFFETLVRIHRASEGATYTGLKPAGIDLGPAILAADKALDSSSIEEVEKLLTYAIQKGLRQHYNLASEHSQFDADNVAAGRLYVKAYVPYVHYVETLWEKATQSPQGHYPEAAEHGH